MGQSLSNQLEDFKDDMLKEVNILKEVIDITHEEFIAKLKKLNRICKQSDENEGRKLHFYIKSNSDQNLLWKQTVVVTCMRVYMSDTDGATSLDDAIDEESLNKQICNLNNAVEVYKQLSLKDFLLAYKKISYYYDCMQGKSASISSSEQTDSKFSTSKPISTSMILDGIVDESVSDPDECTICMERKHEVTLPCAHAYCLFCIEQWNVSNKTCPVCRAEMENTDDSWVTPDIPESSEVNAEIQKALTALTRKLPEED